jgi:hypothetical protein
LGQKEILEEALRLKAEGLYKTIEERANESGYQVVRTATTTYLVKRKTKAKKTETFWHFQPAEQLGRHMGLIEVYGDMRRSDGIATTLTLISPDGYIPHTTLDEYFKQGWIISFVGTAKCGEDGLLPFVHLMLEEECK